MRILGVLGVLVAVQLSGCLDLASLTAGLNGDLSSSPGDGMVFAMLPRDGGAGDLSAPPDAVASLAADLAEYPDLDPPPDLATPPDLAPPPCAGWRGGPNNACWYIGPIWTDCHAVCIPHGGFDPVGATHKGEEVCEHVFGPDPTVGVGPVDGMSVDSIEYCAPLSDHYTDHGIHYGANGLIPTGTEKRPGVQSACACLN